ncbi:MAG: hypothetical protein SGCHY_004270 [Lobulomycetales sp.]
MNEEVQEISRLKSQLEKAMDGNGPPSAVLDILALLGKLDPTEDSLQKTRIALFLKTLRKHEKATPDIKASIKMLVDRWKGLVQRRRSSNGASASSTPTASTAPANALHRTTDSDTPAAPVEKIDTSTLPIVDKNVPQRRDTATPDDSFVETPSRVDSPALRERSLAIDGLTVKTTGNKVRDNCTGMVYTSLGIVSLPSYSFSSSFVSVGLGSDDESSLIMEKAVAIERLTFLGNEEQVSAKYKSRIRSVTFNLKEKANSALRSSILAGDLAVEEFCKMSVEEMASQQKKRDAEAAKKLNLMDAQTAQDTQAETDMFKCGKCKKRKCKYYQLQTRSADEPLT